VPKNNRPSRAVMADRGDLITHFGDPAPVSCLFIGWCVMNHEAGGLSHLKDRIFSNLERGN
jgi:hypothetical protein